MKNLFTRENIAKIHISQIYNLAKKMGLNYELEYQSRGYIKLLIFRTNDNGGRVACGVCSGKNTGYLDYEFYIRHEEDHETRCAIQNYNNFETILNVFFYENSSFGDLVGKYGDLVAFAELFDKFYDLVMQEKIEKTMNITINFEGYL